MNQYVTDGLRVKLAEIQATIRATNQRLRVLEAARLTINARREQTQETVHETHVVPPDALHGIA
jgi:hypothetical protein